MKKIILHTSPTASSKDASGEGWAARRIPQRPDGPAVCWCSILPVDSLIDCLYPYSLRPVRRRLVRRHRGRRGATDLLYKNNFFLKKFTLQFSPQLHTVPKYKLLTGFTAPEGSPWAHSASNASSGSDTSSTS